MQRALIFDMDGTMVDNMPYHWAAMEEFFRRRGRLLGPDDLQRSSGRRAHEILHEYFGELSTMDCRSLEDEWISIYRDLYSAHRKLSPGLYRFIEQATERDIACAVATSAQVASIHFTIEGFGLDQHFSAFVGAADVTRGKPAPDVFLEAAKRCNALPENCIVFEDTPAGVQAAHNAGMRAVVLTTTLPATAFSGFGNVIATAPDFTDLCAEALFACVPQAAPWPVK